jgi:hypothetical protein
LKIDNSSANGQYDYPDPDFDIQRKSDPYMGNEVSTIAECSLKHYRWAIGSAENFIGPSVGGTLAFLREFPHIVNVCCAFKKHQYLKTN